MTLVKEHRDPQDGKSRKWRGAAFPLFKPILVAIVTSIASIFTYVTTPVGDYIKSKIWSEKANILLISQKSDDLHLGNVLDVDIIVQNLSPTPISAGTLEIRYSSSTLRPGAETIQILTSATPKISGSDKVNKRTLEFIADNVGPAQVTAILHTGNGKQFVNKLTFEVRPAAAQVFPTRLSFTGHPTIYIPRRNARR